MSDFPKLIFKSFFLQLKGLHLLLYTILSVNWIVIYYTFPHDDNCIECQMLQVFKLYISEFITFCDFTINVSQSRNRWCTKGYFLTVFFLWLQRSGSFFGVFFFSILYLGVLVWRFNFMRKELDHKDNVSGFLNLYYGDGIGFFNQTVQQFRRKCHRNCYKTTYNQKSC